MGDVGSAVGAVFAGMVFKPQLAPSTALLLATPRWRMRALRDCRQAGHGSFKRTACICFSDCIGGWPHQTLPGCMRVPHRFGCVAIALGLNGILVGAVAVIGRVWLGQKQLFLSLNCVSKGRTAGNRLKFLHSNKMRKGTGFLSLADDGHPADRCLPGDPLIPDPGNGKGSAGTPLASR